MATDTGNVDEMRDQLELGGGAQFWVYISPMNDTAKVVTEWEVTFSQGNWTGSITSADPQQTLQTPDLSGDFDLKVTASGPGMPEHELQPQQGSQANIGCNSNCASFVGIVATPPEVITRDAEYWTTWDAFCSQ